MFTFAANVGSIALAEHVIALLPRNVPLSSRAGGEGDPTMTMVATSMTRGRITIVVILLVAPGTAAATDVMRDATASALNRCLALPANASTAGQTGCDKEARRDYDRRMNAAYAALMRRLPTRAADRLPKAQRAWLAFRDTEAQTRDAIYSTRHGTMYVPMEADAATTLVGDRARLLERYVQTLDIE